MRMTGLFLAAAVSAASLGGGAQAASLGLAVDSAPAIAATGVLAGDGFGFFDFLESIPGSGAGTGALSGYPGLTVALNANIETDGSVGANGGAFSVNQTDLGVQVANSTSLLDFGWVYGVVAGANDTLEFQFGSIGGHESSAFPNGVLVTLTGEFGANLDETFAGAGSGFFDVFMTIEPISGTTVVPLPTTAVLLLTGLASLALRRRG